MYIKSVLSLTIVLAAALLFNSCGGDEMIYPPPSSLLFSWDTLSASVTAGSTGISSNSTGFTQSITATQVKIEYQLQSNADSSTGASASYVDSTNGTPIPPSPLTINVYGPVDTSYSFTYNVSTQPFHSSFSVKMTVSQPSAVTRYIKLINIKVTKVQ